MTFKFGQVLTPEEVAAVPHPTPPFVEPTGVVPVPTDAEMAVWMPNDAPENRRFRWEVNVVTGESKAIELTLDEYKARHVAKIKSKNELFLRRQVDAAKAARQAKLDALVDALEADPTLLGRLVKGS